MLEFVLSKFVLAICAMMVIGAVTGEFLGVQEQAVDSTEEKALRSIADLVVEVDGSRQPMLVVCRLTSAECPPGRELVIRPGALTLRGGGSSFSVAIPADVTLLSSHGAGAQIADHLMASIPVKVIIERQANASGVRTAIYMESFEETSFTRSANLLHSSLVL